MSNRNKCTPEEKARREKIRELLQLSNIGSMEDIQDLFKDTTAEFMENGLDPELGTELGYSTSPTISLKTDRKSLMSPTSRSYRNSRSFLFSLFSLPVPPAVFVPWHNFNLQNDISIPYHFGGLHKIGGNLADLRYALTAVEHHNK